MTNSDDAAVAVNLPARSWSVIDATMDNVGQNSIFEYDSDAERRGTIAQEIRQAGWDQVPWVGPDRAWPPMTQVITVALTAEQWRFALSWLDDSVANPVDNESVELCSTALAVVRPQLTG